MSLRKLRAKVNSSSLKLPLVRYLVTTRKEYALSPAPRLTRVPTGFSRVQCTTPITFYGSLIFGEHTTTLLLPCLSAYMEREHEKDGEGGFQSGSG